MGKNVKLSIGVLVSNRKQYIEMCMESLKPFLNTGFCELIVVDTVGKEKTDGSIEIASKYADKVIEFGWKKDFSAARNECLKEANGEWFMYLDDDEVFKEAEEIIAFFETGEYKEYGHAFYHVHNLNLNGSFSSGIVGRMVKRTRDTKFVGKIHECFEKVEGKAKYFEAYVEHYGYMFASEAERKKHQERNIELIKEEIEEKGYQERNSIQMVQELLAVNDTMDEGFELCQKCIVEQSQAGNANLEGFQWLLLALVRYYKVKDDLSGMIRMKKYAYSNFETSHVYKLAASSVIAIKAAEEGDWNTVSEEIPIYFSNYDWCIENKDESQKEKQLDMDKYFDIERYKYMVYLGAVLMNGNRRYREAYAYWNRMPWNIMSNDEKTKYAGEMQKTLNGLKSSV